MAAKKKADAAVENTAEVTQETTEQVQDTVEQMTEDNKKELDNKKFVVDHLLSTKREGMEDLIDYMEQIGFFEAPCSGGNHLACQFGLVHHSRNVMMAAENIGYALLGKGSVSMNDDIFPLVEKEFEGQVIGTELYELAHQYISQLLYGVHTAGIAVIAVPKFAAGQQFGQMVVADVIYTKVNDTPYDFMQ